MLEPRIQQHLDTLPIGHFSKRLNNKSFVINTETYEKDSLKNKLLRAVSLEDSDLLEMSNNALQFGRKFTLESTVDMMLKVMEERNK